MRPRVHSREVEEQLAEALPILGGAALKQALAGLHELLAACPNPTHQKFMIWLWTGGFDRFGSVSFGQEGAGLRVWLPDDGGDLAVAVGRTEIRVDIDPILTTRSRYAVAASAIEHDARAAAANLLGHVEKKEAKRQRKQTQELRKGGP